MTVHPQQRESFLLKRFSSLCGQRVRGGRETSDVPETRMGLSLLGALGPHSLSFLGPGQGPAE